jgi:hypothetical protein
MRSDVRISVMARSKSAPFKGRIQKRKTNYLQIIISSLQRTAGPYIESIATGKRGARDADRLWDHPADLSKLLPTIRPCCGR